MADTTIVVEGIEDVQKSFERLAKKYPDKAGELLRRDAVNVRKEIVKQVKKETKFDTESKQSLAKAGSYKISQVNGLGINQYVEISAKSPHFHLVENGHNIIMPKSHGVRGEKGVRIPNDNAGEKVGFVQGKHIIDTVTSKHEREMPGIVEDMIDKLLEEVGF